MSEPTTDQNETTERQCNLNTVAEVSPFHNSSLVDVPIWEPENCILAEKASSVDFTENNLYTSKCDSEVLEPELQVSNQLKDLMLNSEEIKDDAPSSTSSERVPSQEVSQQIQTADGSLNNWKQSLNGIPEMPPETQGHKK